MIVRYIVERLINGVWATAAEIPFNVDTEGHARELMSGAALRWPSLLHRVSPFWITEAELAKQDHKKTLEKICDDILRQVVCDCGNYRHHGVSWMPEGSGEGLSVAVEILRKAGL